MSEGLLGLVCGFVGAIIALGLVYAGFLLGRRSVAPLEEKWTATEEERKNALEERDRLIAEQKAFRDLLNYNTDTAYNIESSSSSRTN